VEEEIKLYYSQMTWSEVENLEELRERLTVSDPSRYKVGTKLIHESQSISHRTTMNMCNLKLKQCLH
jgi:hypothetical protein